MERPGIKKPALNEAGFHGEPVKRLLDLGFLVHHVLADNGIKFLDFHLARHGSFVFVRGVKMSGICTGNQADFFA